MKKPTQKTPFYRKKAFLWPVGILVGLILIILIAFRVSPWPGALIIRWVFTQNDVKTTQALQKHQPKVAVSSILNQQYRAQDSEALLDAYFPASVEDNDTRLPVVIWTHGGAWVSGDKENNAPYYMLLAAEGFTVISVDYTLGPEKLYPTALHQLNDAHAFVVAHAKRLHADPNNIVLAGDSAGAQISSQMATLITSPPYAAELNIAPNLKLAQLQGVVLNCGIYKMDDLIHPEPNLPKIVGWGTDVSVWAYTGTRDFTNPLLKQMSAYYHATASFPATYITGGNGDPLTNAQSKPFAQKLSAMGVPVTSLFYEAGHVPSLPHEYQFNLDNEDGQKAFAATVAFIKQVTE